LAVRRSCVKVKRGALPADRRHGGSVFWWFEKDGSYLRCEVLEVRTGHFELRVVRADGTEQVEEFSDADQLATRQQAVVTELKHQGWTGPHGWVL
jgi:hypothetical protein